MFIEALTWRVEGCNINFSRHGFRREKPLWKALSSAFAFDLGTYSRWKGVHTSFKQSSDKNIKELFLCYWCCCFLYKNKWTLLQLWSASAHISHAFLQAFTQYIQHVCHYWTSLLIHDWTICLSSEQLRCCLNSCKLLHNVSWLLSGKLRLRTTREARTPWFPPGGWLQHRPGILPVHVSRWDKLLTNFLSF